MKEPLVIIGSGNMAKTLLPYLRQNYDVIGFAVDEPFIESGSFEQLPIFDISKLKSHFKNHLPNFVISIGFQDMNQIRAKKFKELKEQGFKAGNYVANPLFEKHGVEMKEGTVILENTSIHAGSQIGQNTFISTGVNIGHNCQIGNNVWVNSGVTIAGDVNIGDNTVIGVGATIGNNITIAAHNFIGAGSLIVKSTQEFDTFAIQQTSKLPINSRDFLKLTSIHRRHN